MLVFLLLPPHIPQAEHRRAGFLRPGAAAVVRSLDEDGESRGIPYAPPLTRCRRRRSSWSHASVDGWLSGEQSQVERDRTPASYNSGFLFPVGTRFYRMNVHNSIFPSF